MELTAQSPIEFITGKQRAELGHCEGYHLKGIANSGYAGDTTDYKVHSEWTIRGAKGTTISIHLKHARGGSKRSEITL